MVKWQWRHRRRACVSRTSTNWRCGQALIRCDLLSKRRHGRDLGPVLSAQGGDCTGSGRPHCWASITWPAHVGELSRCNTPHSISRSVSKVEGDVHGHEKATKRRASWQARCPATARRYAGLHQMLRATQCDTVSEAF